LFLKNFQRFKKNKTPDTQARQQSTRQMTQSDDIKMVVTHDRQERQPITAVWRNGGFSASYDSFVVKQTVVLLRPPSTFVVKKSATTPSRKI
jgi:hypothetical protein